MYASWTQWHQLATLHSRREEEEEEIQEREGFLSAIFLQRHRQRLAFKHWRDVSVQLREAKSAAVNRLCSTQNALIRNAFGALRPLPLERSTYHLTPLLINWQQRQKLKLLIRTYWMVWKEAYLRKKVSCPPVAIHCSSKHGNPAIQLHFP